MDEESFEEEEEFELEEEAFDAPIEEEDSAEEPPAEEEVSEPPPVEEEAAAPPPPEPLSSPSQIPMTVSVEVGRLRLTAEKLLNLQPGNLLDLQLPLDSSVDLVVSGKRVGKGELLQVGDMVGVRILELG